MSELQTTRTIEVVGAEIRALTATALNNIIEIGRRMCEAKELLPHGEFYPWIEQVAGYKKSTANNFMRLFKAYADPQGNLFGAEVSNLQTFGGLSYSKALALLDVPAEEREEFVETHDVETMTTKELERVIKERDSIRDLAQKLQTQSREDAETIATLSGQLGDAEQTVKDYSEENVKLTDDLAEAEKRIRELENRPVEVAAQVDEEAVKKAADEAQAQADARWKTEIEKIKKQMADVEKKRDQLEQKVKKAEEKAAASADTAGAETEKAKAEAEKLRAEVDRLSRELKMSGEAVTTCKWHFTAWQHAYTDMKKAVEAMEPEDAGRIKNAMGAQLKAWLQEVEQSLR